MKPSKELVREQMQEQFEKEASKYREIFGSGDSRRWTNAAVADFARERCERVARDCAEIAKAEHGCANEFSCNIAEVILAKYTGKEQRHE